jgi:hypothetical protein
VLSFRKPVILETDIQRNQMSTTKNTKRPIGGTHSYLTDEQRAELDRRALELSGHLLTPRLRNGRRIGIVVDDADYRHIRSHGRGFGSRGVVTDMNTNNRYEIAGAACSLAGCVCAAIAIKIAPQRRNDLVKECGLKNPEKVLRKAEKVFGATKPKKLATK